jgi:hypothetical protein
MRVTAKYTGFDPAFTKGARYNFDVETSYFGRKIKITALERASVNSKRGQEVDHFDLVDFVCSWQIQKVTLSAHESNMIALRDDGLYGNSWLDRL